MKKENNLEALLEDINSFKEESYQNIEEIGNQNKKELFKNYLLKGGLFPFGIVSSCIGLELHFLDNALNKIKSLKNLKFNELKEHFMSTLSGIDKLIIKDLHYLPTLDQEKIIQHYKGNEITQLNISATVFLGGTLILGGAAAFIIYRTIKNFYSINKEINQEIATNKENINSYTQKAITTVKSFKQKYNSQLPRLINLIKDNQKEIKNQKYNPNVIKTMGTRLALFEEGVKASLSSNNYEKGE